MGQFADESEILAIAVRNLIELYGLSKEKDTTFFLAAGYADTGPLDEPSNRLMRLLADAPVKLRGINRATKLTGAERSSLLAPSCIDRQTGERGYPLFVKVGKWRKGGPVSVSASVTLGPLAGRGFSAEAYFEEAKWVLYHIQHFFS